MCQLTVMSSERPLRYPCYRREILLGESVISSRFYYYLDNLVNNSASID